MAKKESNFRIRLPQMISPEKQIYSQAISLAARQCIVVAIQLHCSPHHSTTPPELVLESHKRSLHMQSSKV